MTEDEAEHMNQMLELISSLAGLVQSQKNQIVLLTELNMQLSARLEALEAIAKAKQ